VRRRGWVIGGPSLLPVVRRRGVIASTGNQRRRNNNLAARVENGYHKSVKRDCDAADVTGRSTPKPWLSQQAGVKVESE
jgi:hypothetical protein